MAADKINRDFEAFQDLIRLMEMTPSVDPPAGFTETVMKKVATAKETAPWRRRLLSVFCSLPGRWPLPAGECAFYFWLTGFFYLIAGIVALGGYHAATIPENAWPWLKIQPAVIIASAIWLFFLGLALLGRGHATKEMVRYGTIFFIVFTLVNGMLITFTLRTPAAELFLIGFTAGGVFMGLILARAVSRLIPAPR